MGRRGPAKMPTALRILRGETRPSQINRSEPEPAPRAPEIPVDLDGRALQVWERVMVDFGHTEVIRSADTDSLRCYCDAVARYEEANTLLRKSGPLLKGRRGEMVRNPLALVVRDNANLIRIYARELGLTPAARAGLHVEKAKPVSSLERLRQKRAGAS